MRAKFLIAKKCDESTLRKILDPILLGTDRTAHKIKYKTSMGVVEYISTPSGAGLGDRASATSDSLGKIFLWNRDSTDELEKMLRSKGVELSKTAENRLKGSKK